VRSYEDQEHPMFAASAIHIGENNALLAAFEAATDHASYYPAFAAVEQAINSDELNHRMMEANRVRAEWTRINNALRPMLAAQFRAIRTYSTAELMARAEPAHEAA
jgi:hypothetical protein